MYKKVCKIDFNYMCAAMYIMFKKKMKEQTNK